MTGGKFAKNVRPRVRAPITTTGVTGTTHEGGVGYGRDAKSELFLLAVANMVGEDTFYESGQNRDDRYANLIHAVTAEDPAWVARFVPYLRNDMRMRSAAVVMAAEYVAAGGPNGRPVIAAALQRPDEPAEMIGYWMSRHGRAMPKPVKRGIADAARRLFNERAALKYDGTDRTIRMGDVIELAHVKPGASWQDDLFKYLLDIRHKRENPRGLESLAMIVNNHTLRETLAKTDGKLSPDALATAMKAAGMTWESLSSYGAMDAARWEAVIPSMGQMALVRNLRNFDEVGIGPEAFRIVRDKLEDETEVVRSRQLPIRYFTAWNEVRSLRWGPSLEVAIGHSLRNVPALSGRTLILIDVSGSMQDRTSARTHVQRWQLASVFGMALALRAEKPDLGVFSNGTTMLNVPRGGSLLRGVEQVGPMVGGGTETIQAILDRFDGHDRVIVLTDEQAFPQYQARRYSGYDVNGSPVDALKAIPLIYTFNVAGYERGHLPSGTDGRFTFGGLSDAAFTMLPLLEAARNADWPF
jgi:hypothetical protein